MQSFYGAAAVTRPAESWYPGGASAVGSAVSAYSAATPRQPAQAADGGALAAQAPRTLYGGPPPPAQTSLGACCRGAAAGPAWQPLVPGQGGRQALQSSWAEQYSAAAACPTPSVPSQSPATVRAASVPAPRSSTSFYGDGLLPKAKASLPPIFIASGGRPDPVIATDRRLRAAETIGELVSILAQGLPLFDAGNVVIAFSCGAKLVDDRTTSSLQAYPEWDSLQSRALSCAEVLEPRGLSMLAYSAAKLAWRDERLLRTLARVSLRKAQEFSATDLAKICWAFAKFDYVEQAEEFWAAMEKEVERKVHLGKFVDLSMTVWAFGQVEVGDRAMYSEIAKASLSLMRELPPQSLANIAWAFARRGISDPELFAAISKRAKGLVADFVEFDVSNLCWALARADEVDFELFDSLATHTVQAGLIKRFSAQMTSYMAWAFAVTKVAHVPLFEALASFIARHKDIFDTQHVANCAWAYAAVDVRTPLALQSLASAAKGGKLWAFRQEELSAFCWAFAKVRWTDEELLRDLVQVVGERLGEFDSQGLSNLLSSLVSLRQEGPGGGPSAELQAAFRRLLDQVLQALLAQQEGLGPEALAAAVQSFCQSGRPQDAWSLFEKHQAAANGTSQASTGAQAPYAPLLMEAEGRGDATRAARLWQQLASETAAPALRSVCLDCAAAALAKAGFMSEASAQLAELASQGLFSAASRLLAERLGLQAPDDAAHAARHLITRRREEKGHPYGDHAFLLEELFGRARPGDALSVVRVMEEVAAEMELLEVMAAGRAALLDEVIGRKPKVTLDLGTRVGYAALRVAAQVRQSGGSVVTVEADPVCAAVARSIFELAGITSTVISFIGQPGDCLPAVVRSVGVRSADLALLHGGAEAQYLAELERAEELGLLGLECVVLADHMLRPGAPRFLWRMHSMPRYRVELVGVTEPGVARGEDWLALCVSQPNAKVEASEEVAPPPELPSLTAESARLWRRRQRAEAPAGQPRGRDPVVERFTRRLQDVVLRLGIAPSRFVQPAPADAGSWQTQASGGACHEAQPSPAACASPVDESGQHYRPNHAGEEPAASGSALSMYPTSAFASPQLSRFPAPDLRSLTFGEWFAAVDPAGGMGEYLAAVEDNYDTVAQIVKTYVVPADDRKVLDPQVFDDLGMGSLAHRSLLQRWFAETCGTDGLLQGKGSAPSGCNGSLPTAGGRGAAVPRTNSGAETPHFGNEEAEVERPGLEPPLPPSGGGKGQAAGPDLRGLGFEEWLLRVEPGGSLRRYLGGLADNYDTVAQIVKTYTLPAKGGRVLDPQLFDDLQVECEEHQRAFQQWFAQECGIGHSPDEQVAAVVGAMPSAEGMNGQPNLQNLSFRDWLEGLAPAGELLQYLPVMEESYDTVSQVAKTYTLVSDGEKRKLDEQFFSDAGVASPEHQQLFRQWFEDRCGAGHSASEPAAARGPAPAVGQPPEGASAEVHAQPAPLPAIAEGAPRPATPYFEDWLRGLEPSGSLLGYVDVLQDNYDTVAQIVKMYSVEGGGAVALDKQFFCDVNVTDPDHQAIFERWFATEAKARGAETAELPRGCQDSEVAKQAEVESAAAEEPEDEGADGAMFDFDALEAIDPAQEEDEATEPSAPAAADARRDVYRAAQLAVAELESAPAALKAAAWARCEELWAAALAAGPEAPDEVATAPEEPQAEQLPELQAPPASPGAPAAAEALQSPPVAETSEAPAASEAVAPDGLSKAQAGEPQEEVGAPTDARAAYRAAQEAVAALEATKGADRAAAWIRCDELWVAALRAELQVGSDDLGPAVEASDAAGAEGPTEGVLEAAEPPEGAAAGTTIVEEEAGVASTVAVEAPADAARTASDADGGPEVVSLPSEASIPATVAHEQAEDAAAVPADGAVEEAAEAVDAALADASGMERSNAFFDFDELDDF